MFENMYGVLQGRVLSPNLFNSLLEDLSTYLNIEKGVPIDGIRVACGLHAEYLVQKLIHGLDNYWMQWHMVVYLMRSKVVVFNERCICRGNRHFTINKNKVPTSNTYNYLSTLCDIRSPHSGPWCYWFSCTPPPPTPPYPPPHGVL